jgi:alpha/beta superfamily hydrolase
LEVGINDQRVVRLISIGTPVDKYDFDFVEPCRKPILFVHGEHDEFGSVEKLRELVARVAANAPAELRVIEGAGHFFDDQLNELKRVITEWVSEPPAAAGVALSEEVMK